MKDIYRFTFPPWPDKADLAVAEIERLLAHAMFDMESVYGRFAVCLDAAFYFDTRARCVVIDGSTEVGRHIARLFTALLTKKHGDESYVVERVDPSLQAAPARKEDGSR